MPDTKNSNGSGFKGFLAKTLPFLTAAASLGGPPAQIAVSMLSRALGKDGAPVAIDATEDGILAALTNAHADAATIAAVQQVEKDFTARMQEAGFKNAEAMYALANTDRASARNREIALGGSKITSILALVITAGFFLSLFLIGKYGIPQSSHDIVIAMVGSLGTTWICVGAYYFGSSSGSAQKTELLAKAPAIIQ